jgi:hypothetical protein
MNGRRSAEQTVEKIPLFGRSIETSGAQAARCQPELFAAKPRSRWNPCGAKARQQCLEDASESSCEGDRRPKGQTSCLVRTQNETLGLMPSLLQRHTSIHRTPNHPVYRMALTEGRAFILSRYLTRRGSEGSGRMPNPSRRVKRGSKSASTREKSPSRYC